MEVSIDKAYKRAYRHPKYKTSYRIKNWPEYEQSLQNRGDITFWFNQDAVDARKRQSGYYLQNHAENAFYQYKKIVGGLLDRNVCMKKRYTCLRFVQQSQLELLHECYWRTTRKPI
jgi:hypothetical protein